MIYQLKPYFDAILADRVWSWSLLCILYILAGVFVRGWFMGPMTGRAKKLDGKLLRSIKSKYLKHSLLGWLFFFLPLGLFALLWKDLLPLTIHFQEKFVIAAAGAAFVLSVIFHLQAFGIASFSVLKQFSDQQKEKSLYEG